MEQMEKKYDHRAVEPRMRDLWNTKQIYQYSKHTGPLYSIDTPPPTVSGSLHIGHIFSYTHTDIIARYKRMQGYAVFYPFGFDDNGLPTERFVEKKRGITAREVGRSAFIAACREETVKAEEQFKALWQRIGLSVDWDASYSTISEETRKISQESFIRLYKAGHIYRKDEPALYCTAFQTSVAQADLEDREKETTFYTIRFTTTDDTDLTISTTRPELLPSCVAVLYNPHDERYQHLKDTEAITPLFNESVPIMPDEAVEPEKGTGLVMVCTFGDKTDIMWFKKYTLPYKQAIGFDGRFVARTGFLAGKKIPEAREAVVAALREKGLILDEKSIVHTVSVYERSGREIEYVMLQQWFVAVLPLKEKLVALAEQISWYPSFMKARFRDWVNNLQWDWCLSRQRYYGIPFPVWYHRETGDVVLPDESQLPIDPQETAYPGSDYAPEELRPDTDVMDTWNTSSLTPYICKSLYEGGDTPVFSDDHFLPMSMRPQAHDIIRTWAFYTIVKTWLHSGIIPWNDIVISGHVISGDEKLSKSKNNASFDPYVLLEQYPADVIRYWAGSATLGYDTALSENTFKIGQRLIVKLWNACRFASAHMKPVPPESVHDIHTSVNAWILHRASRAYSQYRDYFDAYEFGLALNGIESFFWHDFCDNYLELIKGQLFNPENHDSAHVAETQGVLYHVVARILQWYAPFMPYVTDAIYENLYAPHENVPSIHMTKYAAIQVPYENEQAAYTMALVVDIVGQVRRLKTQHQLSLKAEIARLTIVVPDAYHARLQQEESLLKAVTRADDISYSTETLPSESALVAEDDTWHATVVVSGQALQESV